MAQTLFDRVGGFAQVHKVVMVFYDKVLDSDVIGDYFDGVDMKALIDHQTKFMSAVMGGPASYTNEHLARAHAHLDIDVAAIEELAFLLRETLEEFDLEPNDIDTVLNDIRARALHIIGKDS
ncbi:MAG: group 1 truncated hemoglobin [Pseudomonadota bacterium]